MIPLSFYLSLETLPLGKSLGTKGADLYVPQVTPGIIYKRQGMEEGKKGEAGNVLEEKTFQKVSWIINF